VGYEHAHHRRHHHDHGDDDGLILPPAVAPIQVVIIPIRPADDPKIMETSRHIKDILEQAGLRVFLDDSDKTPGWKYAQYEMKGVPLRIDVGPRDLKNGVVAVTRRFDGQKLTWANDDSIAANAVSQMSEITKGMYNKALNYLQTHIVEVHNWDELTDVITNGRGYAKMMWCGDEDCEIAIKQKLNASSRCIPFEQVPFMDTCPICGKKAKYVVLFARSY
jgi:prolyl-tRNA synthetase